MGFISTPKRQKVIDGIFRPSSSSSSLSSSLSATSSPRITLAPRCLEFFPTSSLSSTPATPATTTTAIMGTSELEIMKGKRLFVIGEDEDDDDDDEYKEDDSTMNLMKENQDYDTVYNNKSSNNVAIPTRTSRQEFLFRMNHHHDRYSFINRRFVLRTNNNKNNRI